MSFRLYSAATGGAPLWTEQWTGSNGVKVSDGLFNVMLGSLTPIAQSVIAGNSNLFLGITVGTDDEMAPRVQLGSVPFAVQALTVPDGSITTAKLAADVELSNTIVASDNPTAHFSTSASSFVDIAGLGLTVELPQTASVLVTFQYREQRVDTNYYTIRILRDGVSVFGADSHYRVPGVNNHRNITYIDSAVATGSHTYSVQVNPRGTILEIFADAQLGVVAFLGQ